MIFLGIIRDFQLIHSNFAKDFQFYCLNFGFVANFLRVFMKLVRIFLVIFQVFFLKFPRILFFLAIIILYFLIFRIFLIKLFINLKFIIFGNQVFLVNFRCLSFLNLVFVTNPSNFSRICLKLFLQTSIAFKFGRFVHLNLANFLHVGIITLAYL